MEVATILGLIEAATSVAKALSPAIHGVLETASETDVARIKSALADLQAHNDVTHERVAEKLAAAARL